LDVARQSRTEDVDARVERIELQAGVRKPHKSALLPIFSRFGLDPSRSIYVGDSLTRDIKMAKDCGMWAAWARYGQNVDPEMYSYLKLITFWGSVEVQSEESFILEAPDAARPDFT